MPVDILALIATIIFFVIALFLIPMLIQIKGSAQRLDEFVKDVQRDVLPMLKELREASENLNRVSAEAEKGAEKAGVLLDSMAEVGESVHNLTGYVRNDVGRYVGNAVGFWLGMRSAGKAFVKEMKHHK